MKFINNFTMPNFSIVLFVLKTRAKYHVSFLFELQERDDPTTKDISLESGFRKEFESGVFGVPVVRIFCFSIDRDFSKTTGKLKFRNVGAPRTADLSSS